MNCPECRATVPRGAVECPQCGLELPQGRSSGASLDDAESRGLDPVSPSDRPSDAGHETTPEQATQDLGKSGLTPPTGTPDPATPEGRTSGGWSAPVPQGAWTTTPGAILAPDSLVADRYRIVRMLGEGGMGNVYQAEDLELDRPVALKFIRPDLASHPEVLTRFKQEIILARDVTHENVVRIFDLGAANGLKFITMEYVEGRDLKELIQEGHEFEPPDASRIVVQICRALNAAHQAGVIHRDLKPQNVMIDAQGNARVMDFGIARSMEISGLTRTGQMLGTPDYMSPEQAMGQLVDARSDIFSLGLIFYEMMTGELPFKADNSMATLLRRTQERARPPKKLDPDIPDNLDAIICRCLETDPERRYQDVKEILEDLESRRSIRRPGAAGRAVHGLRRARPVTRWLLAGLVLVALGLGVLAGTGRLSIGPSPTPKADVESVGLAILPFANASGDADLDWIGTSLPEFLRSSIGQSSRLRTVPSGRVIQLLETLQLTPAASFDPQTLARLGQRSNARHIVVGQYARLGGQIRIDATLHDLERDTEMGMSVAADGEERLQDAIDRLAASIREEMEFSGEALRALEAASFSPSTESIEALRLYSEGSELLRQGNYAGAQERFEAAVEEDPEFALGHAMLAQSYDLLGFDSEAERTSRTAVELSEGLPEFERLLISARHDTVLGNLEEAIVDYEQLLAAGPEDLEVRMQLAGLYENVGRFDEARAQLESIVDDDPTYVDALYSLGRVQVRSGNPQGALQPLNQALSLTLDNDEARARVLNAVGNTYRRLNRPEEALRRYEEALEINRRLDQKSGIAANLSQIGHVRRTLGGLQAALGSYEEARDLRQEIGDRDGTGTSLLDLGNVYLDMGRYEEALVRYQESLRIQRELGNSMGEGLCLNNIGIVHMLRGDYNAALTHLEQALSIHENVDSPVELANTLHNLGETTSALGQFDRSLDYYLRAVELWRQVGDPLAEATAAYGIGTIYTYQGRLGAALRSHRDAVETLRESGEQGVTLAGAIAGHGGALARIGRFDEAAEELADALIVARRLDNRSLLAQVHNLEADNAVYRGDPVAARRGYRAALQTAEEGDDAQEALIARLGLAAVDLQDEESNAAVGALEEITRQADQMGQRYLAAEARIRHAEALLGIGRLDDASRTLQEGLNMSERERLDFRVLKARGYWVQARLAEANGDPTAAERRYRRALAELDEIRQEAGDDDPLVRNDLARIHADASRTAG